MAWRRVGARPPRVLVLTSSLGGGHLAAARAVEAGLRERLPHAQVQTLDFWSLMDRRVAHAIRHAYLRLVEDHADLYDTVYGLDQQVWHECLHRGQPPPQPVVELAARLLASLDEQAGGAAPGGDGERRLADRLLFRQTCSSLARYVRGSGRNSGLIGLALANWCWTRLIQRMEARAMAFEPDVLVATVMWSAALYSRARERGRIAAPMIAVPTDYGVHDFWVHSGVDRYCVAHDTVSHLDRLRSADVRVTGIPLMPSFRRPPSVAQARGTLGLAADRPVLLVAGGSLGLGVGEAAARLLAAAPDAHVLALTGHNGAARAALEPLASQHPQRLQVWGWTDRVEVFLRAADIVVGKLGGVTVAEALACGRPLLATRSLRGQEGFNQRFLEQHGVGGLVADEDLAPTVRSLLAEPSRLARLQQRAAALGRRDGAARVAELVETLASTGLPWQALREPA
jgi:processive 1,2-diacylglycerol beta-glucosyltransferase